MNNKDKFYKRNPLTELLKGFKSFKQRLCVLACIIFYSTLITSPALAATLITNTATANFSVNGTPKQVSHSVQFTKDIIVPPSDVITITKQANATDAFIGDTVTYTLKINNSNNHVQNNVRITDTLPSNISYQAGTATLNGTNLSNSQVALIGNQLSFNLGNIPANTTWSINYDTVILTSGIATNKAIVKTDSATSAQVSLSINIAARTPSTIKFLKISDSGISSILPPTFYNNDPNGGQLWQEIDTITLPDGTTATLPIPQPIIDATHYSLSEPIIIEVTDLDQNVDSTAIDKIIVEVVVPGTGDTEILLLQEISPNSGIFRGVLLTTIDASSTQDGLLSLEDGSKINVNYKDEIDSTDISATAALVVPSTAISLTKVADKTTATIGELIKYTLNFTNNTNANIPSLSVIDHLPLGFRYIPYTVQANLNGVPQTITVNYSGGQDLSFDIGNTAIGQKWTIEYLTKITTGVQIGDSINTAYIDTGSTQSTKASATVIIKDDLMRSKSLLTGRVYIGCNTKKGAKTLKDVRIFTETGRTVLSDEEGFWHMESINAGKHVLQLDKSSLPVGYKPLLCEENTRFAKNASSQFVDLVAGSLWQADFFVMKADSSKTRSTSTDNKQANNEKEPNPFELFDLAYLKTASNEPEIIWPKNNYVPAVASTSIFIKSSPKYRVKVLLNGKVVSPLNYDGSKTNKSRTVTIRRWKGVDLNIKNRNNTLLVIFKDKSGKEVARKVHNIHFSGEATSAKYLPEKSILIADGKTIPIIAIFPKDKDGFRLRAGAHGYFSLENSQFQVKTLSSSADTLNLNESLAGTYKYHVDADGIARIALNPTTQSGEVELKLKFPQGKYKTLKTWLKPQLREWILVGLAEGTLAHNTLSGNMTKLTALDKADTFSKRGRVSFYAQGKVKGKYLLTIAYDTHKEKQEVGTQLNGTIDPDAWYTIYGDNSNSQYNAPSSRKLYLKIEKENFYALFGDFNTSMNITELAKYERVLNGIKSEYKGEKYSYSAFISETYSKHQHDEIPGDGTSGLYHLSSDIVANSETIKIEVRDRFHSEQIIDSRILTRYQDYDIDYDSGTLFFKFPVTGRDENFNPQIIVIDYDSNIDDNKEIVLGGRVASRALDGQMEIGLSAIYVNKESSKNDTLLAADMTYRITPDTMIHAEVAQSKSEKSFYDIVNAQLLEIEKENNGLRALAYYRRIGKNFGINSQESEDNTEKVGAEISYKINDKTSLKAEVSEQKNLDNDNKRELVELSVKQQHKQLEMSAGLRHSKEKLLSNTVVNDTILAGVRYTTKNGRITYRANAEENINTSSIEERSPNRRILGVDLKINNGMSLFAEHERTDNNSVKTENFRVGLSKSLWTGAKAKSTYTKERTDQGQRDYATLGLSQRIKISKNLNADISIDHAITLSGTQERFNVDEPLNQGSQTDDYTAFSIGMGSQIKDWSWTGRFELRDGDSSYKTNLQLGLIHHLKNGKQVSMKFKHIETDFTGSSFEKNTELSIGTAWHPKEEDFVIFSRLDLIDDKAISTNSDSHTQKIIHNVHYNQYFNKRKSQVSLHHGIKYVIDNNNTDKYSTTIDTATVQLRHDISKKWNIGAKAGYLHDWEENTTETLAGISVGVTPAENTWLELGYNFNGFDDNDFDNNNYKQKGVYLDFSYKFDQNSLNNRKEK